DHGPGRVDRERVTGLARELVHRGQVAQFHDRKRYCASALPGAWGLGAPSPARKASSTVSSATRGSSVRVRSARSPPETMPSARALRRTHSSSGVQYATPTSTTGK